MTRPHPDDMPLFDLGQPEPEPAPPTEAPPTCPLCRLRPIAWGHRKNDWARYCGGSTCTNSHRKCLHCEQTFPLGAFRFVKYCSQECADGARGSRLQMRGRIHHCVRCGTMSESHKEQPHGWRDGRCSDCWRTRIGNDRMKSLIVHNVPFDRADHWAQMGWICDICGDPVAIKQGAIDHDHDCCPGSRSCGKCVRGFVHNSCNVALGFLHDDPTILRAAADYLDQYNQTR